MEDNQFKYTYTALTEQDKREIERIKDGYLDTQDKLKQLKRLDARVKSIPKIWALVLGVIGTLIFGIGLTMCLEWEMFVAGVIISAVGIVPVALAYPVYNAVSKRCKEAYKDKILSLADELLNDK